jgi:hypothetical protein
MENRGDPCPYCVNYNELCDALNTIEQLEETVQSTWDGVREMLDEIAATLNLPTFSESGLLTNGELVTSIISKIQQRPQTLTVAESAGPLYFALNQIVGEGIRRWPVDIVLDGSDAILNAALDTYEKVKSPANIVDTIG